MQIITVRGTGEPLGLPPSTMLAATARKLAVVFGADLVDVPYAAQYGPVPTPTGQSYERSVAEALGLLDFYANQGPFVLLGYSMGARIAGDFAKGGHRNLVATGLVADPLDPGTPTAFGVGGRRRVDQPNTYWAAHPRDMICRCPTDSPIRTLADQTSHLSLSSPQGWAEDMIDRLARARWQKTLVPWTNPIRTWKTYSQAVDDVLGYLPPPVGRGYHTSYNTELVGGRTRMAQMYRDLARHM